MNVKPKFIPSAPITDTPHYRSSERGVALIVVLLFLILIMLAGAMAVRQSNTDLKTATADQINTQLLQSADSANKTLETIARNAAATAESNKTYEAVVENSTGAFGYFMPIKSIGDTHKGDEFVYCYKPSNTVYDVNTATIYKKTGGKVSDNGICDYNKPTDYTTSRETVMTQVSVKGAEKTESRRVFPGVSLGRGYDDAKGKSPDFDIRVVAALPSYNEPDGCFEKGPTDSATAASNTLACLHEKNTPSKMIYTHATMESKIKATKCVAMGKLISGTSIPSNCTT